MPPVSALYEANKKYFANEESDSGPILGRADGSNESYLQRGRNASVRSTRTDPLQKCRVFDAEFKKDSETYISADVIDSVTPTDRILCFPQIKREIILLSLIRPEEQGSDSTAMSIGHV